MSTNLGRVGFVPKGNWSAGTYRFLDVVRYNSASYVCMVSTTTNNPSNATDWMLLNKDGAIKFSGLWADKPSGATLTPYADRIFITDIGMGGSEWYWDGSRYRAVGSQVVLKSIKASDAQISATLAAQTSGTLDYAYSIPAGLLKEGDVVTVEAVVAAQSGSVSSMVGLHRAQIGAVTFTFGQTSTTTLPTAVNGTANVTRLSILSGFKVNSDTSVSAIYTGTNGYGSGNIQANRNVGVTSVNGTSIPLTYFFSCASSTATVVVDNLLITLKTCG